MRQTETCLAWVVYRMTLPKQAIGGNVVCEQREWDAIDSARPGYHVLIRSGIKTEQEAEKLARGTAGDPPVRGAKKAAQATMLLAPTVAPASDPTTALLP